MPLSMLNINCSHPIMKRLPLRGTADSSNEDEGNKRTLDEAQ